MNKKIKKGGRFYFSRTVPLFSFFSKRLNGIKSITLIELLISIIIVSIMVLSFYSLEEYSHSQTVYSLRRSKVQDDLNYALEFISKYVQQANGTKNDPGIEPIGSGFRVRVDLHAGPLQTPSDTSDDGWISYSLSGNTLSASCSGTCGSFVAEDLSSRIIPGFSNTVMPDPMPSSPAAGFYVRIDPDSSGMSNVVEVGLVGRYDPATAVQITTNPQVGMKSRLICNSCSTN